MPMHLINCVWPQYYSLNERSYNSFVFHCIYCYQFFGNYTGNKFSQFCSFFQFAPLEIFSGANVCSLFFFTSQMQIYTAKGVLMQAWKGMRVWSLMEQMLGTL